MKAAAPCCAPGQWRESKAGEDRIDFRYVTLRYCIAFAYGLKEFQVSGPAWVGETRYDIVAKAAAGTRHNQLPAMVRQLLGARFKLQAHHEPKEFNVFVIVVGKKGLKLKESPPDPERADGASIGMSMSPEGLGRIEVKHGSMAALAGTLSRLLGRPVVDLTRLTAVYDFELEYAPEDARGMIMPDSSGQPVSREVSVFASMQKLGLSLEAQKPTLDAIIVDSAEKAPSEN